MRHFAACSYEEQVTRLTATAQRVMAAYGLDVGQITLLVYVNNAVFEVQTSSGRYILRMHRPHYKTPEIIRSELIWLHALHSETALCVPSPVLTQAGEWLAQGVVEGLETPLTCVLFHALDGAPLAAADYSLAQVEQVGAFLGRLHAHSRSFVPLAGFTRPRLDYHGLFGANGVYAAHANAALFTASDRAIFAEVGQRVREVMAALAQEAGFGLIHADCIAKNMLWRGEALCVIDFDDCAFGYYLYDLAPFLLNLSGTSHYEHAKAALWEGYTAVRHCPPHYRDYLETFIAARHVASCYWVAGNQDNPYVRGKAAQLIRLRVEELADFLRTGKLERRSTQL